MYVTSLFALACLASSASASLDHRAACSADNCYRAVQASSAKPGVSSARQDCSSFMTKTVTPSAATTTKTSTVTVTATAPTSYASQQIVVSPNVTAVQTTTIVNTVVDTVTITTPSAVVVPTTIVVPVTVTGVAPARRNEKGAQGGDVEKAAEGYIYLEPDHKVRRAAPTTTAPVSSSNANDGVPTYASACSGAVRYSSACSCAGVTGKAVTASQPTSTATATTTVTVTPAASIITTFFTVTKPVTVTVTQTVSTTIETTGATVGVASLYTQLSPVTVTTTVTVSPPVCNHDHFVLQAGPNGLHAGMYAYTDNTQEYASVGLVSDMSQATRWRLTSDGNIVQADTGSSPWGSGDCCSFVYSSQDYVVDDNGEYQYLVCALTSPPNAGSLSCSTTLGTILLQTCAIFDKYDGLLVYLNLGLDDFWGPCSPLDFAAVPVPC